MDPRHRILRRVRIEDVQEAENIFSLLMGSDVAPRREFIVKSAAEVDRDHIDA
jgi:DNA gyrase subunit B